MAALAGILVAVLLGGCADFLAPPADAARLSLSLNPGPAARQTGADSAFDAVDGLSVRILRRQGVVMADSFAVAPAGGVIRRVILVPVEGGEETLELAVELHAGGRAVFAGSQALRVVRGALTTAEVELVRVCPVPARGLSSTRFATRHPGAGHPLRPRAGELP